mmetsp:Transcript_64074/g.150180  ORF Transcript_64074/g.150180 Transcript_64074/m.150180 type:complete len:277 (-) Transcript_64074:409-1239(-)
MTLAGRPCSLRSRRRYLNIGMISFSRFWFWSGWYSIMSLFSVFVRVSLPWFVAACSSASTSFSMSRGCWASSRARKASSLAGTFFGICKSPPLWSPPNSSSFMGAAAIRARRIAPMASRSSMASSDIGPSRLLPPSRTDGAPRRFRTTASGFIIVVRWKTRSPLMRGSDWVPGAGRCAKPMLSISARSPLSHSTRRMLRLWVSGSIPSIAFCSASCTGSAGKNRKLDGQLFSGPASTRCNDERASLNSLSPRVMTSANASRNAFKAISSTKPRQYV